MIGAVWFDTGPTESSRLLLVVHHLAVDGVSWRIILTDLAAAWQDILQDRRPEPEPVGTSLRGWAEYLAQEALTPRRVEELPVWRDMLHRERRTLAPRPLDPVLDTFATRRTFSLRAPVARTQSRTHSAPRPVRSPSATAARVVNRTSGFLSPIACLLVPSIASPRIGLDGDLRNGHASSRTGNTRP
jgi:hypothetical protein